jgi:hypothetical protein
VSEAPNRRTLPTGRWAAKEVAEFAPQGEYAFEYPFAAASTIRTLAKTVNLAGSNAASPIAAARVAQARSATRGELTLAATAR